MTGRKGSEAAATRDRLLLEVGVSAVSKNDRAGLVYRQIGRWLVRNDVVRPFLLARRPRLADLVRSRPAYLAQSDVLERSPLVLVRTDGRPKVSFFDLTARRKLVCIRHSLDFERELEANEFFGRIGVDVPEVTGLDASSRSYCQRLVCDPLAPSKAISFEEMRSTLMALATCSVQKLVSLDEFIQLRSPAITVAADCLPKNMLAKFRARLGRLDSLRLGSPHMMVPLMRCHGDMSIGNVLRGDNGRLYVNDFDRSFIANGWFDVTYFAVTTNMARWVAARLVSEVTQVLSQASGTACDMAASVARDLMAIDLVAFVAERYSNVDSDDDRLCRYSVDVLGRLVGH